MAEESENILGQAEIVALAAAFLPMAASLAAYYQSLQSEGFTPSQAFDLVLALQSQLIANTKPS